MSCNENISTTIPNTNLCRVTSGPFAGEVTDQNQVIQPQRADGASSQNAGIQIGSCDSNGLVAYTRLPDLHAGPEVARDLLDRFASTPASNLVRFDASASRQGVLCVSLASQTDARSLLTSLRDHPNNLPENTRESLRDTLGEAYRLRFHEQPPMTWGEHFFDKAGDVALYAVTGIIGVGLTFGVIVPWLSHWFGPPGGGGSHGPLGGGGSGTSSGSSPSSSTSETTASRPSLSSILGWGAATLALGLITVAATLDPVPGDEVVAGTATAAAWGNLARATAFAVAF